MNRVWAIISGILCLMATTTLAQEAPVQAGQPILLTADEMSYDSERRTVTARGNVEVSHDDRVLIADEMVYNQGSDLLTATGNVTLMEPTGDVVFAQHMELTGDLKDGIIEDLRVILSDRSRFAANGARRSGGNELEMSRVVYSPCELCPDEPTRPPLWQLKAAKVLHDKERQTIEYSDVWLEVAGLPIAYTPYLSHPDPTVKRRSGFLAPSIGGSSDLGIVTHIPYFLNIDPFSDLTLTPSYATKEGPLLAGEYRHRLQNGSLDLAASITQDSENDIRGHVNGEGRFDVDDTWRWGFDANGASHDTYLRRYGFGNESTLTTRVFTEGFRKRNYMAFNGYVFQGLRSTDDAGETPFVLPMVDYNHIGEPDRLGGRASLDVNLLALTRTDGSDTRRLSVKGGWRLPYVGPMGDVYALSTTLTGDLYHVDELARAGKTGTHSGFNGRLLPQMALDWRYPLVREEEAVYQLFEPIVSAVVSPYGGNPDTIPNEDSIDFEFDDTNLFSSNRFTGLDRVEGGPRVNYGLKWGVFGRGGGATTVLVGQSLRAKKDDTFATGSGLEDQFSDIVARVQVRPDDNLDLVYRARWDKDNLAARRNEIDLRAGTRSLRLSADYVFFAAQENSEFAPREELTLALDAQLSRYWRAKISGIRDLTGDGAMLSAGLGLTYEDECLVFTSELTRTFFRDRDLTPTDAVVFRVNFKTLGEVATSIH
ncbi:MAG: LPS assembly protein LptD [Rhodospirillales bacterium]|jgi:LPS-assembly protein|nr:LPS assembly protein LptD [Rhodospirillales bacterium]